MPKEVRNPKCEKLADISEMERLFADFWVWGDEIAADCVALHDEQRTTLPPARLMERTAMFGEAVISFAKRVSNTPVTTRLISQLVGAATSVGANYCEADDSVSGKDFKKSISTCRKESKEAMFFLRMIGTAEPDLIEEARKLWREAKELNLIFGAIWRKP